MKNHRTGLLLFFLFGLFLSGNGQTEIKTDSLALQQLNKLQATPAKGMTEGLFSTYRKNQIPFARNKVDNNAFYSGLIVNILRANQGSFNAENALLAERMIQRALPAFKKFKHRKGKPTYYFWPVDTPRHFPNSFLEKISSEKRFLPDDADCSVILLEAANASEEDKYNAHLLFEKYAATDKRKAIGSLKKYRKYQAYSTWLGYAIPVDYDLCVHANILRFVDKNYFSWNAADSATAQLILALIQDRKHIKMPRFIAPYYGRTSIILYHLSRWMKENRNGWMEPVKASLIADAKAELQQTTSPLEILLLRTSLRWWGADIDDPLIINTKELQKDKTAFFRGNVGAYLSAPLKRVADRMGIFTFNFYCPAFNEALLLQYRVLAKNVPLEMK